MAEQKTRGVRTTRAVERSRASRAHDVRKMARRGERREARAFKGRAA